MNLEDFMGILDEASPCVSVKHMQEMVDAFTEDEYTVTNIYIIMIEVTPHGPYMKALEASDLLWGMMQAKHVMEEGEWLPPTAITRLQNEDYDVEYLKTEF